MKLKDIMFMQIKPGLISYINIRYKLIKITIIYQVLDKILLRIIFNFLRISACIYSILKNIKHAWLHVYCNIYKRNMSKKHILGSDTSSEPVSHMIISLVRTSTSVASGRPYLMFSMTEVANSTGSYRGKYEVHVYEYTHYSI